MRGLRRRRGGERGAVRVRRRARMKAPVPNVRSETHVQSARVDRAKHRFCDGTNVVLTAVTLHNAIKVPLLLVSAEVSLHTPFTGESRFVVGQLLRIRKVKGKFG